MNTATAVTDDLGTLVYHDNFSFPITVDFVYPVSTSPFGYNITVGQNYQTSNRVTVEDFVLQAKSLSNAVTVSDVSPATSSQIYTSTDSNGPSYSCHIKSTNNTLIQVGPQDASRIKSKGKRQ